MMHRLGAGLVLAASLAAWHTARADAGGRCAFLDTLYPQPGRSTGGQNAFRPPPVLAPMRAQAGDPGTLSLSITADHVSSAAAGAPGAIWVGNYLVTDIPAFRILRGAAVSAQVIRPEDGRAVGIPDECLGSPDWAFTGTQWALVQGDTLDVLFRSRLDYAKPTTLVLPQNGGVPCRASNLHTHGLLVSPYHPLRAGLGPMGDYVLDGTQPHGSHDWGADTDDCGTALGQMEHHGHGLTDKPLHYVTQIPGQPGVSSLAPGEHPSGLFWYHPHPHGFSGSQIGGAMTGAITVGALTDYACPQGDGSPGHCTITNATTRIMVLKDTALQTTGATWSVLQNADSGLCAPTGGTRLGECQGVEGSVGPTKWVFTVNGVQFPVMKAPAGRLEIWRIVNASASMTYSLSIDAVGGAAAGAGALPFQLLAKDGVSVATPDGHAIRRTQMLVMPASRIEIAIPAPESGGTYRLHNDVVQTGQNGSGDIWPSADLAQITWDKMEGQAADAAVQVAGVAATPIPRAAVVAGAAPGPCRFVDGDRREIAFVHRLETGTGKKPVTREIFGLIAGVQHADGTQDFYSDDGHTVLHSVADVWNAGINGPDPAFPAFGHNDFGTVCTVKGNVEPWTLTNWTGEVHNFHMHQTRFSIDPNGAFQSPLPEATASLALRQTDEAVRDFADPALAVSNDTIPVPRGQSFCANNSALPGCGGNAATECPGTPDAPVCKRPGITSIIADFTRPEQVGTFVYHCHIMEHEDGGMMAMIRVLCPPGDASCASQQAQTALCRPPG